MRPTHRLTPAQVGSHGGDAIRLAEVAGLELYPWQKAFLRDGLGVRANGRWSSPEVGVELSRQNGKSVVFEARTLAGLFLFREEQIVYTAHSGETVMKAFARIEEIIGDTPDLHREVRRVRRANGKEEIELHTGESVMFRTRTPNGGRGLSGDCVILDEAQELNDDHVAALIPTLRAMPNPQTWYGGSAGNARSIVLGRLVRRAEAGADGLTMYRWAATEDDDPADPRTWAKTNPLLGRRIYVETMATERGQLSAVDFASELLGMGDYPRAEGEEWIVPQSAWDGPTFDPDSIATGRIVLAVEVKPDRHWAAIAAAGRRPNGRGTHVEVLEHRRGVRWIVDRVVQLVARHPVAAVVIDPKSPAESLIGPLQDAGVAVTLMTLQDVVSAFSDFYDAATGVVPEVFHRADAELTTAIASAKVRKLGGGYAVNRYVAADVTPFVSVLHARHGLLHMLPAPTGPPSTPLAAEASPGALGRVDVARAGF